jgi:hypothetical protein
MKITFGLEASPIKGLKHQYAIYIRCTQNRKHRRINTSITISSEHWNKQKKEVRKSHPLHRQYNQLIQTHYRKVLEAYNQLLCKGEDVYLQNLTEALQGLKHENFFDFANRTKIEEFKASKKLGVLKRDVISF